MAAWTIDEDICIATIEAAEIKVVSTKGRSEGFEGGGDKLVQYIGR